MGAERGFPTRFPVQGMSKRTFIQVGEQRVLLNEYQIEALRNECDAALREFDDEHAAELHEMVEAESADSADPMNA